MSFYKKCFRSTLFIITVLLLSNTISSAAPDGKALFLANCAACHNPLKDVVGPALKNIDKNFPSKEWGYKWVRNSQDLVKAGDKTAVEIFNKFNKVPMLPFPQLSNDDIDAILKYANEYVAPVETVVAPPVKQVGMSKIQLLYCYITIALFIIIIALWKINHNLKRKANTKQGILNLKEVPYWRHKVVLGALGVFLFILAGYWIVNGAINEGRQQNYQPEQPIFYSHKVHAGINQVNCLYCHSSAEKSRMAMIPSSNVCMNCHKQISSYSGEKSYPLVTAEGKHIDGTKEISKLYEYAGWDANAKKYKTDENGNILAKPIEWVKIHNLPRHVYFNHSQHVKIGKVQCQKCHGPITEMDEVYQYSALSMGWCVNCHRQTNVQFMNNDYYNSFEQLHNEMKDGKRKGVTVEEIGGLECQKCHY